MITFCNACKYNYCPDKKFKENKPFIERWMILYKGYTPTKVQQVRLLVSICPECGTMKVEV